MSQPSTPEVTGIRESALSELTAAGDAAAKQAWRNRYLGRQGEVQKLLDGLKAVPSADRPAYGKAVNELRQALEQAWEEKGGEGSVAASAPGEFDPTLPGRPYPSGAVHVLTQTLDRIVDIFHRLGFSLADGPEIETEHHNFDALNTPPDHPARDEADTVYLDRPCGPGGRSR